MQDLVNRLNDRRKRKQYSLVEDNVYDIPRRLKEYDPSMFVLYNHIRGTFEVHSTDNKETNTYCLTIPYKVLDSRTLDIVARGDMKTSSGQKYLNQVLKEEAENEKKNQKEQRDFTRDFAMEHQSLFKKAKTEMGL